MEVAFHFSISGQAYQAESAARIAIGKPLNPFGENNLCYYAENPSAEAIIMGDFVGSVAQGGAVNYYQLHCTPHGNGTHTECVGHITKELISVWEQLQARFFSAQLLTVKPHAMGADQLIRLEDIQDQLLVGVEALVLRCSTTDLDHYHNFSETNPPYIHADAMRHIYAQGISHLLFDQPSVDKEYDEGKLAAHHIFWNVPDQPRWNNTITELIRVPKEVADGLYLLQFELSPILMDAVPSMPYLYPIKKIGPTTT